MTADLRAAAQAVVGQAKPWGMGCAVVTHDAIVSLRAALASTPEPAPVAEGLDVATVEAMEREGVVTWGDPRHRERFLALASTPEPAPVAEGLCVERLHDIIEWLGTDIESVMRTPGEKPSYQAWVDATVKAHVMLSGCTSPKCRAAASPSPETEGETSRSAHEA